MYKRLCNLYRILIIVTTLNYKAVKNILIGFVDRWYLRYQKIKIKLIDWFMKSLRNLITIIINPDFYNILINRLVKL